MSANIDTRLHSATRTWAPRTADLDNLSTSDIREDHTSDLQAVKTHDVALPEDSAQNVKAPVFTPLVQSVGTLTSDLDMGTGTSHLVAQPTSRPREPAETRTASAAATARVIRGSHASDGPRNAGIAPGCLLKDRYLIEQVLGSGGTALVFRARDLHVDKNAPGARIALKTPRPEVKDQERAIVRLQHEFKHAQALAHPNIARVLELNSDDQTWFMTMELIEGRSLAALIREPATLPESMKRTVLTSCAQALAYAHSNDIVHGDFKPANVLVSPNGQVKVFDFGAATSQEGEDTRIPAGTPAYASPQVLSGVRPDSRDDVFSFACVAYELLTGQHPFDRKSSLEAREQGKTPARAWNLASSQWLALLSALAWERDERPRDISMVLDKLLAPVPPPSAQITPEPAGEVAIAKEPVSELPDELVPTQRSWGFFVFLAVAGAVLWFATQRESSEAVPVAAATIAADTARRPAGSVAAEGGSANALGKLASSAAGAIGPGQMRPAQGMSVPTTEGAGESPLIMQEEPVPSPSQQEKPPAPPAPVSTISFSSDSIVTSESAIAAVFVVKRSGSLAGRTSVEWRAHSGSATIGEDFIVTQTGTVEFADGQAQRAVYIPLRNDLVAEGDETFTIELMGIRRGRLGEIRKIDATIKDDD